MTGSVFNGWKTYLFVFMWSYLLIMGSLTIWYAHTIALNRLSILSLFCSLSVSSVFIFWDKFIRRDS
jgi:hypothetical protein